MFKKYTLQKQQTYKRALAALGPYTFVD